MLCTEFNFEHTKKRIFFDHNVIILTSSVHRTQSICVLFSPNNSTMFVTGRLQRQRRHI